MKPTGSIDMQRQMFWMLAMPVVVAAVATASVIIYLIYASCVTVNAAEPAPAENNVNVLSTKNRNRLLNTYLMQQARTQFAARRKAVEEALTSPEKLKARQQRLREDYRRMVGHLPSSKTPLSPEITGTIKCKGYRIEKVAFESRPNHHVTANLYIPDAVKGPLPGVVVLCGHTKLGKAYKSYQNAAIILALNGCVAFVVDPICQGERFQFLHPNGRRVELGRGIPHSRLDVGSLLVGTSVVGYELWDNIRAIDYLVSRPEVDPDKIGCTGTSGGGTQTTFLMSVEKRIKVAAPSCYIMTRERKFETIGPADGCQYLPNEGPLGFEHADYITMRAPQRTVILAAIRDSFDIRATRRAYAEAKRVYQVLGRPDDMAMFEADVKHGFTKPHRQACATYMRKWMLGDDTPAVEGTQTLQSKRNLDVTKSGLVGVHWPNEVTTTDLNLTRARELTTTREKFWKSNDRKKCLNQVKNLLGMTSRFNPPAAKKVGTIDRDSYTIEKWVIQNENDVPIPGLLFVPKNNKGKMPATLYVDGRGKARDCAPGGPVEDLVKKGQIVFTIDLRGFGETVDDPRRNHVNYRNVEQRNVVLACHIGRPLVGQRVVDTLQALDFLLARNEVDAGKVTLIGLDRAGPVALHAAAIDARISSLILQNSMTSWFDLLDYPLARNLMTHIVPSAMVYYDFPDLIRSMAPRPVKIINPINAHGKPQAIAEIGPWSKSLTNLTISRMRKGSER